MVLQVSFYFDFGSFNVFFCYCVIFVIEWCIGVMFDYVLVLFGGLFKLIGNQFLVVVFVGIKNKLDYDLFEMWCFIVCYGIMDFQFNLYFLINMLYLMCGVVMVQEIGVFLVYVDVVIDVMWICGLDMGQFVVFVEILFVVGLLIDCIFELLELLVVKQWLIDNINVVFEKGVFGILIFLVGDEFYFGKDWLCDVEEVIIGGFVLFDVKVVWEVVNKIVVVDFYNFVFNKCDIDGVI